MTELPQAPPPATEPSRRTPLVISPPALILALAFLGAMIYNIHVDAGPSDYNGLWVTGIIAALIAGVLGYDLKFPGRGGDG